MPANIDNSSNDYICLSILSLILAQTILQFAVDTAKKRWLHNFLKFTK